MCLFLCVYIYNNIYVCIYIYVCVYIYMYAFRYIYIYILLKTCIYIYIYTYIQDCRETLDFHRDHQGSSRIAPASLQRLQRAAAHGVVPRQFLVLLLTWLPSSVIAPGAIRVPTTWGNKSNGAIRLSTFINKQCGFNVIYMITTNGGLTPK